MRNRDKRITMTMTIPPELQRQLEMAAEHEHRSRSNMLSEFIRAGLEKQDAAR
jgi:predicted transcriptional regulator